MIPGPVDLPRVAIAVDRLLGALGIPHCLIGGLACALRGRPRLTQDVDFLVILADEAISDLHQVFTSAGYLTRVPDLREFALSTRVMPLRHPSGVDVDLVVSGMPLEDSIVRASTSESCGEDLVSVARVEDLILMKLLAGRPRDLTDIEGLIACHPRLDRRKLTREIGELTDLLEDSTPRDLLRRMGLEES